MTNEQKKIIINALESYHDDIEQGAGDVSEDLRAICDAMTAVTAAPDAAELLNALDFLLDVAELRMPNYSSSDNIARALDLRKRLSGEGESQENK